MVIVVVMGTIGSANHANPVSVDHSKTNKYKHANPVSIVHRKANKSKHYEEALIVHRQCAYDKGINWNTQTLFQFFIQEKTNAPLSAPMKNYEPRHSQRRAPNNYIRAPIGLQ